VRSAPLRAKGAAAQSLTSAISNAVVRIYAEHIGRGPTKARTVVSRNLVSVVLEDTFTKGERTLVDAGERDTVLATRHAYQRALREPLRAAVEQLTGRKVVTVLSDHQDDPDVAIENFILEPDVLDEARLARVRDATVDSRDGGDPEQDGGHRRRDGGQQLS
jgi:uncharacterized protein YbcI